MGKGENTFCPTLRRSLVICQKELRKTMKISARYGLDHRNVLVFWLTANPHRISAASLLSSKKVPSLYCHIDCSALRDQSVRPSVRTSNDPGNYLRISQPCLINWEAERNFTSVYNLSHFYFEISNQFSRLILLLTAYRPREFSSSGLYKLKQTAVAAQTKSKTQAVCGEGGNFKITLCMTIM